MTYFSSSTAYLNILQVIYYRLFGLRQQENEALVFILTVLIILVRLK